MRCRSPSPVAARRAGQAEPAEAPSALPAVTFSGDPARSEEAAARPGRTCVEAAGALLGSALRGNARVLLSWALAVKQRVTLHSIQAPGTRVAVVFLHADLSSPLDV